MAKFSQQFIQGLLAPNPMTVGMMELGKKIGDLGPQMKANRLKKEREEALSGFDPSTPQGLAGLASFYQKEGDMGNAVKYATAARTLQGQIDSDAQLTAFQEQVARTAEKAGLVDQAKTARSTRNTDELRAINEDVRKFQIEQLPEDNPGVIRARLRMAGFTAPQIQALGTISAEEAKDLLEGRTGDLEAWVDSEGNIKAVNVNKFGLVYDNATKTYRQARELGLVSKAPQVQEVIDKGQATGVKEIAEANVENFVALNEKAINARDQIAILDRQTARLEGGMPTGLAANVELNLRRFGELIGFPYDPKVTSAENYISEAAKIVAEQIKDFGAGTGLSDADREYAKIGAGADITQQQEALLNLLKIRRSAMARTVELYNEVRNATAERLGEENMTTFMPISLPSAPKAPELELEPGFVLDE